MCVRVCIRACVRVCFSDQRPCFVWVLLTGAVCVCVCVCVRVCVSDQRPCFVWVLLTGAVCVYTTVLFRLATMLRAVLTDLCISGFMLCMGVDVIFNFTYIIDNVELAAMVVLPALLPDARCKVDINKIIYLAQV